MTTDKDNPDNPYAVGAVSVRTDLGSMSCPSCGDEMVAGIVRFNGRAWFLPAGVGFLRRLVAWGGKKVHPADFFMLAPFRASARCQNCQTVVIT